MISEGHIREDIEFVKQFKIKSEQAMRIFTASKLDVSRALTHFNNLGYSKHMGLDVRNIQELLTKSLHREEQVIEIVDKQLEKTVSKFHDMNEIFRKSVKDRDTIQRIAHSLELLKTYVRFVDKIKHRLKLQEKFVRHLTESHYQSFITELKNEEKIERQMLKLVTASKQSDIYFKKINALFSTVNDVRSMETVLMHGFGGAVFGAVLAVGNGSDDMMLKLKTVLGLTFVGLTTGITHALIEEFENVQEKENLAALHVRA